MILFPNNNNAVSVVETPYTIPNLRLWYDPNFILDSGADGTANSLFNRAPISPKSNAASLGAVVPSVLTNGYGTGHDSIIYNGASTYYQFSNYNSIILLTSNSFTFFWFEKSSLNDYYVFDTTQIGSFAGIGAYWTGGRLHFEIKNGGVGEYSVRTNIIQDTLWHSYAVVYNGSQSSLGFTIYRDGAVITSSSFNNIFFVGSLNRSSGNIGRKKNNTNYMTGELGHLMLYASQLNASQIVSLNSYY